MLFWGYVTLRYAQFHGPEERRRPSYFGGTVLNYQPGDQLSLLRFIMVFLSPSIKLNGSKPSLN
jgi:hypothetical protein